MFVCYIQCHSSAYGRHVYLGTNVSTVAPSVCLASADAAVDSTTLMADAVS